MKTTHAAVLIHARTKDVDFRSRFLAVPGIFTEEMTELAVKYVTNSTEYFELVNEGGRRVIFSLGDHIVSGISIFISELYRACGKTSEYETVDGKRRNYAFIGFVFHKSSFDPKNSVPYEEYIRAYEKIMAERWNDKHGMGDILLATKTSFEEITVDTPEIPEGSVLQNACRIRGRLLIDENSADMTRILYEVSEAVLADRIDAFCSDVPNATLIAESRFSAVSSRIAANILASCGEQTDRPAADRGARKRVSTPVKHTYRTAAESEHVRRRMGSVRPSAAQERRHISVRTTSFPTASRPARPERRDAANKFAGNEKSRGRKLSDAEWIMQESERLDRYEEKSPVSGITDMLSDIIQNKKKYYKK